MMIFVSGPYSSSDPEVKKVRVKAIASACMKIMQDGNMAISPLTFGLSLIEKSEQNLPDSYEFWDRFCREFVATADVMYVLDLEGWELSSGVKDEIAAAKKFNIPVKLVHPYSLNVLEELHSLVDIQQSKAEKDKERDERLKKFEESDQEYPSNLFKKS